MNNYLLLCIIGVVFPGSQCCALIPVGEREACQLSLRTNEKCVVGDNRGGLSGDKCRHGDTQSRKCSGMLFVDRFDLYTRPCLKAQGRQSTFDLGGYSKQRRLTVRANFIFRAALEERVSPCILVGLMQRGHEALVRLYIVPQSTALRQQVGVCDTHL